MHLRSPYLSAISSHFRLAANHHVSSLPGWSQTFVFNFWSGLTRAITIVFWSWFPISSCGVRTVLLFVSCLAVFVLRVGQMHLGSRTTPSSLSTLRYLFPLQVAQTFAWYLFSAWWFTEIYVWSSSTGDHLEMVKRGRYVTYCKRVGYRTYQTLDLMSGPI